MFEVQVESHFDAAHFLRGYKGKCENLHGHRFRVVVRVRGEELNEAGVVYDFRELRDKLEGVLAQFDHTCLNELPRFKGVNPSSENLAQAIYKELQPQLGEGVKLSFIEVWESPHSGVRFSP